MNVQCFDVGVKGADWTRSVMAISRGKAKYDYWLDVSESWPDVKFTDITCRVGSLPVDPQFERTAIYRRVPFARVGMTVRVGDWPGVIVGSNASANFNVLFTEGKFKGQTLNCHPESEMRFFDESGHEIERLR